jgi:hypothetical protein
MVAGDIFEQIPAGGDTYVLKRLLFDFSDDDAMRILGNCRKVLGRDAHLLIIEALSGRPNEEDLAHFMDLLFLVMLGGRVRSEEEYAALFERTGLRLEKTTPTAADVTILQARAA